MFKITVTYIHALTGELATSEDTFESLDKALRRAEFWAHSNNAQTVTITNEDSKEIVFNHIPNNK